MGFYGRCHGLGGRVELYVEEFWIGITVWRYFGTVFGLEMVFFVALPWVGYWACGGTLFFPVLASSISFLLS